MKDRLTGRGFKFFEFDDANGIKCSLQQSSAIHEDEKGNWDNLIWLGCDDANPRQLIPGQSWQPILMPKEYIADTRMHLTREQVKELLPILKKFVKTGEI